MDTTQHPSTTFQQLATFITKKMRMSHLYQPLMLRTLINKGGTASLHDIASAFLTHDESQIEITERMPVLTRHQLVERDGDGYRLIPDVQQLSRQERDRLLRLCDEALETYTGRRGRNLYDHRRIALGNISGTARYVVLKRAGFRCDLCGISAEERALEVDHILPRRHAGTERRSATKATPTRLWIGMTPQLYGAGAIWGARRA
jgi:ATP adenylyltransferase